jgi:bifunctional ADP-heptose synthase (sugar kinase/adenylyltransferase)
VLARGGQVRVMPFVPGHSSSEVLARVRGEAPEQD